jgi:hypothetical protein
MAQVLITHGIVNRAIDDVDTFTDDPAGVRTAGELTRLARHRAVRSVCPKRRSTHAPPSLTGREGRSRSLLGRRRGLSFTAGLRPR